jgi:hypothetical protein
MIMPVAMEVAIIKLAAQLRRRSTTHRILKNRNLHGAWLQ